MADTLTHRRQSVRHHPSSAALVRSLRAASHRSVRTHPPEHPLISARRRRQRSQINVPLLSSRDAASPPTFEGTVALLPPSSSDLKTPTFYHAVAGTEERGGR